MKGTFAFHLYAQKTDIEGKMAGGKFVRNILEVDSGGHGMGEKRLGGPDPLGGSIQGRRSANVWGQGRKDGAWPGKAHLSSHESVWGYGEGMASSGLGAFRVRAHGI